MGQIRLIRQMGQMGVYIFGNISLVPLVVLVSLVPFRTPLRPGIVFNTYGCGEELLKKLFLQLNLVVVAIRLCNCSCGGVNTPAKYITQIYDRYRIEFFVNYQNFRLV